MSTPKLDPIPSNHSQHPQTPPQQLKSGLLVSPLPGSNTRPCKHSNILPPPAPSSASQCPAPDSLPRHPSSPQPPDLPQDVLATSFPLWAPAPPPPRPRELPAFPQSPKPSTGSLTRLQKAAPPVPRSVSENSPHTESTLDSDHTTPARPCPQTVLSPASLFQGHAHLPSEPHLLLPLHPSPVSSPISKPPSLSGPASHLTSEGIRPSCGSGLISLDGPSSPGFFEASLDPQGPQILLCTPFLLPAPPALSLAPS